MDSVSAVSGAQVQNLRAPPVQPVEALIARPIEQAAASENARTQPDAKRQQQQRQQQLAKQFAIKDRNINILLDQASGRVVFQSIDPESGEIKNQVPAEQILRLVASLRNNDASTGFLIDNRA